MAKIVTGHVVGQISGSIAGTTYSRNRYGQYIRNRSVPVASHTEYATNAKARLGAASEQWRNLTNEERLSWQAWANNNPITDVLGQTRILAGNAAFNQINTRLQLIGEEMLTLPPSDPPPLAPLPFTIAPHAPAPGTVGAELAFDQDPALNERWTQLYVTAAVVHSQGINYVENLLKFLGYYPNDEPEPSDSVAISNELFERFGVLEEGYKVVVYAARIDPDTGLLSSRYRSEWIAVT